MINGETIQREIVKNSRVHMNVGQGIVVTTEDKIRLCLMRYLKGLEQKQAWVTPLSICITIVLTLLTTDFKDFGFAKSTWQAVFILGLGLSFIWLIVAIWQAVHSCTVDDIVEEIKKGSLPSDDSTEAKR